MCSSQLDGINYEKKNDEEEEKEEEKKEEEEVTYLAVDNVSQIITSIELKHSIIKLINNSDLLVTDTNATINNDIILNFISKLITDIKKEINQNLTTSKSDEAETHTQYESISPYQNQDDIHTPNYDMYTHTNPLMSTQLTQSNEKNEIFNDSSSSSSSFYSHITPQTNLPVSNPIMCNTSQTNLPVGNTYFQTPLPYQLDNNTSSINNTNSAYHHSIPQHIYTKSFNPTNPTPQNNPYPKMMTYSPYQFPTITAIIPRHPLMNENTPLTVSSNKHITDYFKPKTIDTIKKEPLTNPPNQYIPNNLLYHTKDPLFSQSGASNDDDDDDDIEITYSNM